MTMKGRIQLSKINLLGYTTETQEYTVQNAGGIGSIETSKFLQGHKRHFQISLFCGQHYYTLKAPRIAKFKDYCASKGFEVVEAR